MPTDFPLPILGRPLRVALALSLALTSLVARADELSAERIAALTARIDPVMREQSIPGISVAVGQSNALAFEKGFGSSDMENAVPATTETVYRTASIAKPITAVIVLRLAEEGKLDLDATVQRYLPEFPEKEWPVTTRQLLAHLGGIRHYGKPGESTGTRHFNAIRSALALFARDPLVHEPGTKFLYSTFGFNLAGAVAEVAGSRDYGALLREIVAEPTGSPELVVDDHFTTVPHRARGYAYKSGQITNAPLHDTSMKIPGGGLLSSAGALVRFASAVNTGALLRAETVAAMWTPQKTKAGQETGYGLGWKLAGVGKTRTVWHGGGQAGTSTFLLLEPESGDSVALLCNREGAALETLAREILALMKSAETPPPPTPGKKRYALVVHGGAGTLPTDKAFRDQRHAGMEAALTLGRDMLARGASSIETVEAVVRLLEDDPAFNAGKGAVLNADGVAECDASIMDGRTLACGAAAATRTVRNPVTLARAIMDDGRHVLLGGEGADRFAAEKDLALAEPEYFITPLERNLLEKARAGLAAPATKDSRGTVGCVALDAEGNLAAATSTGGRRNKVPGRIGDSPVIGAGTYANNETCAVSGTGIGEEYIRLAAAYDVHARMAYLGKSLEEAIRDVLFSRMKPGDGGLIGVDAQGNTIMLFNTPGMARAAADSNGDFTVEVEEVP